MMGLVYAGLHWNMYKFCKFKRDNLLLHKHLYDWLKVLNEGFAGFVLLCYYIFNPGKDVKQSSYFDSAIND